jgi:hypothetical protein
VLKEKDSSTVLIVYTNLQELAQSEPKSPQTTLKISKECMKNQMLVEEDQKKSLPELSNLIQLFQEQDQGDQQLIENLSQMYQEQRTQFFTLFQRKQEQRKEQYHILHELLNKTKSLPILHEGVS